MLYLLYSILYTSVSLIVFFLLHSLLVVNHSLLYPPPLQLDPINIFFGVYKTDNAPIRLSYHGGVHYNSIVDPYAATIGVGLGLAGHKPGVREKERERGLLCIYTCLDTNQG